MMSLPYGYRSHLGSRDLEAGVDGKSGWRRALFLAALMLFDERMWKEA
jgi:hypothetical protein